MTSWQKIRFLCSLIPFILLVSCDYKLRDTSSGLYDVKTSLYYKESSINRDFLKVLEKVVSPKQIYKNKSFDDTDLTLKILDHKITRYSAALGSGARTTEARIEYFLKINIELTKQEKGVILEIKDQSSYSFDESKILAIEQVENELKNKFFTNSISRINFSLLRLLDENS